MSPIIRVLVADSEPLFCLGIQKAVELVDTVLCVNMVATCQKLLASCAELQPDVLLLGCNVQHTPTVELIAKLRQSFSPPLILLILDKNETAIQSWVDAGIAGAILRHEGPEKWVEAIKTVTSGERWFSSLFMQQLLKPPTLVPTLNERERLLLALLIAGKMDAAIANQLSVSEVTVRRYIKTLYEKFAVETRVQLAYLAGDLGLLN